MISFLSLIIGLIGTVITVVFAFIQAFFWIIVGGILLIAIPVGIVLLIVFLCKKKEEPEEQYRDISL